MTAGAIGGPGRSCSGSCWSRPWSRRCGPVGTVLLVDHALELAASRLTSYSNGPRRVSSKPRPASGRAGPGPGRAPGGVLLLQQPHRVGTVGGHRQPAWWLPWWRWTTDAPADVEPQAGALADRLGGVEGAPGCGRRRRTVHAGRTRCQRSASAGWSGQEQRKALCHAGSTGAAGFDRCLPEGYHLRGPSACSARPTSTRRTP